jgi:glycosyltransferase involved in cell wall biosynthesis
LPKVTIILTSYNHEKYLRDSIDSVLGQTFTDFELIIGDDASTDDSWNIIQSYTDPRIFAYRHESNRGAGTINEIILSGKASGEYIAIHHSDDMWEPEKLEKQVTLLEQSPQIGAVFTNVTVIDENNQPLEDNSHVYQTVFAQPNRGRYEWLNYFFYKGNALCHPTILIRKECYTSCGLYRYGLAQLADFDMWIRLCLKYDIHILPGKLVRLRVRSSELNSSGNRPEVRIRGQFEYFEVLRNYKGLTNPQEFIKVFPSVEKYITSDGFDLEFALGMAALAPESYNITKLFGLQNLFEVLNDPVKAEKVKHLYGFSNIDFIALTARHDVFSFELITSLKSQIGTLGAQILEKESQILEKESQILEKENQIRERNYQIHILLQEIADMKNSRAWKLLLTYRKIRSKFFQTNQTSKTM